MNSTDAVAFIEALRRWREACMVLMVARVSTLHVASIITPLVIGVIIANTNSFDYAILYVGSMGVLGLFSYLFIVGPLDRLTLTPRAA